MRLYHIDILPYLPNSDLRKQWRDLLKLFENKSDIFTEYATHEPKALFQYSVCVLQELWQRHIKVNIDKSYLFTKHNKITTEEYMWAIDEAFKNKYRQKILNPFPIQHTDEYFEICYFILKEKYIYCQKDFSHKLYNKLSLELHNRKIMSKRR